MQQPHFGQAPSHIGHVLTFFKKRSPLVNPTCRTKSETEHLSVRKYLDPIDMNIMYTYVYIYIILYTRIIWEWTSGITWSPSNTSKTLVLRLLRCEGRHFAHGFIGHCLDHVRTLDARRGVASVKGWTKTAMFFLHRIYPYGSKYLLRKCLGYDWWG